MFICLVQSCYDRILKTGTVTRSAFNLNPSADRHTYDNDVLFDRKIQDVTAGLIPYFQKLLYKLPKENAWTIANYIMSMKTEVNLTDNYRRDVLKVLANFSIFCNNKLFKQVTKDNLVSFLDSFRNIPDLVELLPTA